MRLALKIDDDALRVLSNGSGLPNDGACARRCEARVCMFFCRACLPFDTKNEYSLVMIIVWSQE